MNPSKLQYLVSQALPLLNRSYMHFKHAALIVRKGRIIACGFNDERYHAEVAALRSCERLLQGKQGRKED